MTTGGRGLQSGSGRGRRLGNPMQSAPYKSVAIFSRRHPPSPSAVSVLLYAFCWLCCFGCGFVSVAEAFTVAPAQNSSEVARAQRFWRLITRDEWGARPPTRETNFTGPAPYAILHHSFNPGVCLTEDACKAAMRSMQNFHMDGHGWPDIGYSFAVGGDGNVYAARGYNVVGAHAPNYNSQSVGLLLIGNFVVKPPPAPMLQIAQDFLLYSIEQGHLREDYVLYGHRQVRETECPGDAMFNEIKKWEHWREVK